MRINVYAEEMTDRVEIVEKDGFTGVRFYLYLPVTIKHLAEPEQVRGQFLHHDGDDDSSAVTFWGKAALKEVLQKALKLLEQRPYKRCTVMCDDGSAVTGAQCLREDGHDVSVDDNEFHVCRAPAGIAQTFHLFIGKYGYGNTLSYPGLYPEPQFSEPQVVIVVSSDEPLRIKGQPVWDQVKNCWLYQTSQGLVYAEADLRPCKVGDVRS